MKFSYQQKINLISNYFNVSEECALYLYHRRKRGAPWRNPDDPKYLEWSKKLQNALIQCDKQIDINWELMIFGEERDLLEAYGIFIEASDDETEWTIVRRKKKNANESIITMLGL